MAEKTTDAPKVGHNRFDKAQITAFLDRFDNLDAQIDKLKDEFDAEKQVIKDDKKALLEDIEQQIGIPKKAMKHILEKRALQKQLAEFDERVEDGERHIADLVWETLGLAGTPLGDFAERQEGE